jgi:hypothetical protein
VKFTSQLQITEADNAGIVVPAEAVTALGGGNHPKVVVTLNGFTYRSSVAKMGDLFLIPASKARRVEGKLEVGVPYDIEIELDTAPREVELPEELASHFAADPAAKAAWEAMSYSIQLRTVTPILTAKKPETRQRNVDKVIAQLKGRT